MQKKGVHAVSVGGVQNKIKKGQGRAWAWVWAGLTHESWVGSGGVYKG